jgi:glycerophosphoryl diester phosphodiesterase
MKSKVIGHRGCGTLFPENTLVAVQGAIDMNLNGIEIDVHITDNNQLVVTHDNIVGDITQFPKLEDVFELITNAKADILVFVELKSSYLENVNTLVSRIVNTIKKYNMTKNSYILSFDERPLRIICELHPDLNTCQLLESTSFSTLIPTTTVWGLEYGYVTMEDIRAAHNSKKQIMIWTPNTPAQLQDAINMNVDFIVTDRPDTCLHLL